MSSVALKPVQVQECQTVTKYVPFDEEYTPSITQEELESLGHAGKYYDALSKPPSVWLQETLPGIVLTPPGAPPHDTSEVPVPASFIFLLFGVAALVFAARHKAR